jgi:hypothetical protein
VRLWINGSLVIDQWTSHSTTDHQSAAVSLAKNQRYPVTLEFYDNSGAAVAKLYWKRPGQTTYSIIPVTRLYAD